MAQKSLKVIYHVMKDSDRNIFISLFREACIKCFGIPLISPLSEADSRLMSNVILEATGLVIGAKSIRNYSHYVAGDKSRRVKEENPGIASLDTLARYVLSAPYTDEIRRKNNESHHPYWFQYKNRLLRNDQMPGKRPDRFWKSVRSVVPINTRLTKNLRFLLLIVVPIVVVSAAIVLSLFNPRTTAKSGNLNFTDDFNVLSEEALLSRGWILKSREAEYWDKRGDSPGQISLYTLRGDNWPLGENLAGIRNLLIRPVTADCFFTEIHLSAFMPRQNWQQAGIILSEDSTFTGKMIRLSLSYNDFFGGYAKEPEVIIQVVSSSETGPLSKPEEIAHIPLFSFEPGKESLAESNLAFLALKIEKKKDHFRFLYSASPAESFAYKEAISGDYDFSPRWVSLFAIQGWSDNSDVIPARFDKFSLFGIPCIE